jgi:hypothetical protein
VEAIDPPNAHEASVRLTGSINRCETTELRAGILVLPRERLITPHEVQRVAWFVWKHSRPA